MKTPNSNEPLLPYHWGRVYNWIY